MVISCSGNIYLSRGDDAVVACEVYSDDGEASALQSGDRLVLEIAEESTGRVAAELESEDGLFVFDRELTLRLGGEYTYRVVLIYSDGTETTVIGRTPNKTPHLTVME